MKHPDQTLGVIVKDAARRAIAFDGIYYVNALIDLGETQPRNIIVQVYEAKHGK